MNTGSIVNSYRDRADCISNYKSILNGNKDIAYF